MKERPILFSAPMVRAILDGRKTMTRRALNPQPTGNPDIVFPVAFPHGRPGDRLWVRETFRTDAFIDGRVEYRATPKAEEQVEEYDQPAKWRPSIFMPRWASRILLEITAVRIERLQVISEEDAKSEGVTRLALSEALGIPGTWQGAFADLWDSLNAKRGFGWDANPWVWVISFKKLEATR